MSESQFNQANRQSYAAIVLIIYRLYKTLFRQLWPFLLVFALGGRFRESKELIFAVAAMALMSAIYGIIAFFKYYFFIQGDQLIIEKGVLKKTKTSIPLDRVQTVDFEQNILHRIFNVVRVKIDTAGSSGKELNLQALNINKANALRSELLSFEKVLDINVENDDLLHKKDQALKILSINVFELLKVGISENHFKSAWLIFIFFFWLYENLKDAGIDMDRYWEMMPQSSIILQSMALVLSLSLMLLIASFIISLLRTVLRYFNLEFTREKNKFKITSGLLNRRELAAMDNKIQMVSWSQNVLQKLLNLFELSLRQASSAEVKLKKTILVPGIKKNQIECVNEYLFDNKDRTFNSYLKPDASYFYRFSLYILLVLIGLLSLSYYFEIWSAFSIIAFIGAYQIMSLYLRSIKYGIAVNDEVLMHLSGTFGNKTSLLSIHKIQSIKLVQSIYQRRKNLADVLINTAGGYIRIPYINLSEANKIRNYCLYKVETSKEKWM